MRGHAQTEAVLPVLASNNGGRDEKPNLCNILQMFDDSIQPSARSTYRQQST